MFRLLWVIFRHKFQDLLYILFCSFYVLQFFCPTIAIGIPFLHYKTRVNVYVVLGWGVVGSCFWCPLLFVFGGWGGFHVLVNLLVAVKVDVKRVKVLYARCMVFDRNYWETATNLCSHRLKSLGLHLHDSVAWNSFVSRSESPPVNRE